MVGKGLNTHVSDVKADIILSTTLPITPIIIGDCFERGTSSERPSAATLKIADVLAVPKPSRLNAAEH
ncbi:hypothetical protein EYF80_047436 [Liparis tanakae]|uniref:Uncharacterized protein n=1 Tax=Liparis tanakae TaxID=230148 RepID=A0A4Z2FMC4_9TELE|nr:hypothetical protein EYF80_047436 [Liparis tanakae]